MKPQKFEREAEKHIKIIIMERDVFGRTNEDLLMA